MVVGESQKYKGSLIGLNLCVSLSMSIVLFHLLNFFGLSDTVLGEIEGQRDKLRMLLL